MTETLNAHAFKDAGSAFSYMLAGRATVTFSSVSGVHYSFRVNRAKGKPGLFYVKFLSTESKYIGFIKDNREFVYGAAKAALLAEDNRVVAFRWVWDRLRQGRMPNGLQVWHEGRCGRCSRPLTDPESIRRGLGPECHQRRFKAA